jgi:hypothetical protein
MIFFFKKLLNFNTLSIIYPQWMWKTCGIEFFRPSDEAISTVLPKK